MMDRVPTLSCISQLVSMHALLDLREDTNPLTAQYLVRLAATGIFAPVSPLILTKIIKEFPQKLTNELLLALSTPHMKSVSIEDCSLVTPNGLVKLLQKCGGITNLDVTECPQLTSPQVVLKCASMTCSLTSVTFKGCDTVFNETVQVLLMYHRRLSHLNVSGCCGLSDEMFLLPVDHTQNHKYASCLCSVDLSSCRGITSDAIKYLVSLCGPQIIHLNLAMTQMDYLILHYLSAGLMTSASHLTPDSNTNDRDSKSDTRDAPLDFVQKLDNLHLVDIEDNDHEYTIHEEESVHKNDEGVADSIKLNMSVGSESDKDKPVSANEKSHERTHAQLTQNSCEEKSTNRNTLFEINDKGRGIDNSSEDIAGYNQDIVSLDSSKCTTKSSTTSCCGTDCTRQLPEPLLVPEGSNTDDTFLENSVVASEQEFVEGSCISNISEDEGADTACFLSSSSQEKSTDDNSVNATDLRPPLYTSRLKSLDLSGVELQISGDVVEECVKMFILRNPLMENLCISWRGLTDEHLELIGKQFTHLRHLSLIGSDWLSSLEIAKLFSFAVNLESLDLEGVIGVNDFAMLEVVRRGRLKKMILAACQISDITLFQIAELCKSQLLHLDLSWCEEISTRGLNAVCTSCTHLQSLSMRQCPATSNTLTLLADHCPEMTHLNITSVKCVYDTALISIATRLRCLVDLDISWNLDISDVGVSAVVSFCNQLKRLNVSGIKQLTSQPFVPIISNYERWRRCQALLRFKLKERQVLKVNNDPQLSSDEEFEELSLPHRSTVYAPNLRRLEMEYSDAVNDRQMQEVVAVCRGSLDVIDYYGQLVEPCWITCKNGVVQTNSHPLALQ